MEGKDVKCPACGMVNRSLFLEETGGRFECEACGHTGNAAGDERTADPTRDKEESREKERLTPQSV